MTLQNAPKSLAWLAAAVFCVGVAANAAAEPIYYTAELKVDPAKSDEFLALMKDAAVDTRAFKGCQYFAILVDETNPGRVLFYEIWDSKADHQAYRAWRAETKFGDRIAPFLAGPPVPSYFVKFDD
jgi:quinol monooxygenase YgiN